MRPRRFAKETDRKLAESAEEARQERAEILKELHETVQWLKESNKKLEGLGLVQGEITEDLSIRTVEDAMRLQGISISAVYPYPRIKGVCEYDLLAVNGNERRYTIASCSGPPADTHVTTRATPASSGVIQRSTGRVRKKVAWRLA